MIEEWSEDWRPDNFTLLATGQGELGLFFQEKHGSATSKNSERLLFVEI